MATEWRSFATRALDEARKAGATYADIRIYPLDRSQDVTVENGEVVGVSSLKRIADGQVYQPPAGEGSSIAFSCVIDGKRVSAACDSLESFAPQLDSLLAGARHLPQPAEEAAVPDGPFLTAALPLAATYDAVTAAMDDTCLIDVVERVNAVMAPGDLIFDGAVAQGRSEIAFANSLGTYQTCRSTNAELQVFGFDRQDRSISAYQTVAGKALAQFPIEALAESVAQKVTLQQQYLARHGGKRIDPFGGSTDPKRFDVILERSGWAGLFVVFSLHAEAWNAKMYHDGTSFFSGKLGREVMGKNITIWDDPLHPLGIPQPFDLEGHPTKSLVLVENGIAKNVVYDTALAKKHGAVSTGHALWASARHVGALPMHLVVAGGTASVEDMIRASQKPTLWITTLHYIRSTHQQDGRSTGTTLHGAFLVENGEVVGPIENLRFEESLPEVLGRITHQGKALPTLSMEADDTPYIVPPMRAEGFRFVSVADRSV